MAQTLTEIIKGRRSVRKFKGDMIPKEQISEIIEAGLYAASGKGLQSSLVVAVTNRELRDKIAEANRRIGGWDEGFDPFYGAPVILIVLGNAEVPTHVYDGSLSLGNMMLKAHELGLGSIWIHRAKEEFEGELGKEILKQLGLTGTYEGVGHLALGYSAESPKEPPARKDGRVFWVE